MDKILHSRLGSAAFGLGLTVAIVGSAFAVAFL